MHRARHSSRSTRGARVRVVQNKPLQKEKTNPNVESKTKILQLVKDANDSKANGVITITAPGTFPLSSSYELSMPPSKGEPNKHNYLYSNGDGTTHWKTVKEMWHELEKNEPAESFAYFSFVLDMPVSPSALSCFLLKTQNDTPIACGGKEMPIMSKKAWMNAKVMTSGNFKNLNVKEAALKYWAGPATQHNLIRHSATPSANKFTDNEFSVLKSGLYKVTFSFHSTDHAFDENTTGWMSLKIKVKHPDASFMSDIHKTEVRQCIQEAGFHQISTVVQCTAGQKCQHTNLIKYYPVASFFMNAMSIQTFKVTIEKL